MFQKILDLWGGFLLVRGNPMFTLNKLYKGGPVMRSCYYAFAHQFWNVAFRHFSYILLIKWFGYNAGPVIMRCAFTYYAAHNITGTRVLETETFSL